MDEYTMNAPDLAVQLYLELVLSSLRLLPIRIVCSDHDTGFLLAILSPLNVS